MNKNRVKRIAIVLFIVGITALVSLIYLEKEVSRISTKKVEDFEYFSIRRSNELRNNLQLKKNALKHLVGFFNSSNNVSEDEFKLFTSIVAGNGNLMQVCWHNTQTIEKYYFSASKKNLCDKVDFIESSNIYNVNGKQSISLTEFTTSFSKIQKGVISIFLI